LQSEDKNLSGDGVSQPLQLFPHVLAEESNSCSDNENNAAIDAEIVSETDDEYCKWEVRTSCHWQHFFNK
jgi:hypothetical protein